MKVKCALSKSQYHRALMVLAWTLTVSGFIVIFVDIGGWVPDSISENPHPLIGCITTGWYY